MPINKTNKTILPPSTIGIIGGGQLGRMMAIEARYMGYKVAVLDPTPHCPTAQIADEHIVAAYDDLDAIKHLTALSDVITYEFENVDLTAARYIEEKGKLPQGADALEITQHREREKKVMKEADLPVAPFAIVNSSEECKRALDSTPLPAVIKTCQGGYDGKGQLKINSASDFEEASEFANQSGPFIIEQWIAFDKEISVIFSRSIDGVITYFPIAENIHKDHILYETIAPARITDKTENLAKNAAKLLAETINVVGTFAIEMFVKDGEIFINEMAPRPHNSGHYTIEACNVSQFHQHIRAICGLPLIDIQQLQFARMVNVLGEDMEKALDELSTGQAGFVHFYGKAEAKEKRKMGHITFVGESALIAEKYANLYKGNEEI